MKNFFLIFLGIVILYSCEKEYTKVDGTNKMTFDNSIKSISSKLTILQQDKMQEALKFIYRFRTKGNDENKRWEEVYKLLNDKNAEQIFDIAEDIAKENKIVWTSTSMNTLNDSVFEEESKPLTEEEVKFEQIEDATRINLKFSPVDNNPELNDGFYLYPEFVDDAGTTVEFKNISLVMSISFVNNGTLVYVTKKNITSSEVGDIIKKKGIKIPYNMFDRDKLANASVDVEVKVSGGNKYLYGKLSHIPIDLNKTKVSNSIENQMNSQIGLEVVKSFINEVGDKNYSKAYALTKNSKWGTEEDFSSTKNGFGTIKTTNFLTSEIVSSTDDKMIVFAMYQIKDKNDKVKTIKQNFILNKLADNWYIVDTEVREIKEDSWK